MIMKIKPGNCLLKLMTLVVLGWLSPQAQAFISGSIKCSLSGYPSNGYEFAAGAEMKVPFSGTCTAVRTYPSGAGTNLEITAISGTSPANLQVLDPYSNTYMLQLPLGSWGAACLGGTCAPILAGRSVSYVYYVVGTAPSTPGRRTARVKLGVTSTGGWQAYAEWFHEWLFIYNVRAVSCSLSSPSAVNLKFGTISSANLSAVSQSTSVSLNCPSSMRANVTLTPSQSVVSANTGVSRTTLAGLNMQAIWTDSGNPVVFTSPRAMVLRAGSNSVNLSFKPQLEAGKSPAGAFQSQYTLNINYQ